MYVFFSLPLCVFQIIKKSGLLNADLGFWMTSSLSLTACHTCSQARIYGPFWPCSSTDYSIFKQGFLATKQKNAPIYQINSLE